MNSNLAKAAGAGVLALVGTFAGAAYAGTITQFANGVTAPEGVVKVGNDYWIADHVQGFCRLDATGVADGSVAINVNTCNKSAVAPGQPTYDGNSFVYVPDDSSKSEGVWRLTYNPTTRTVGRATLMAPGKGLSGIRTVGTALSPDGKSLYISSRKDGNIRRIPDITLAPTAQTVQTIGRSTDGRRVLNIAFVGSNLYLVEGAKVSVIENAPGCGTGCGTASPTDINEPAPMAIISNTSNGISSLYIANVNNQVKKYTIDPNFGSSLDTTYSGPFQGISGLGFDSANGTLFVGGDPTLGTSVGQGFVWKVTTP